MAKDAIFVQEGRVIDYTAGATEIGVGDVVAFATGIGVALEDIPAAGKGSVQLVGVWQIAADGETAFNVGDQLYWDATNAELSKTATDNTPAGICVAPKAASGTTALVKIG